MKEESGSDQKRNVLDALPIQFCNDTLSMLSFGFNFPILDSFNDGKFTCSVK